MVSRAVQFCFMLSFNIPEGQDDDESQNDINQNSSTGDVFDNEGPTEGDYNESTDDNDEKIQNESASDGYVVAPEMNNTEELGAESSENSGVNDVKNIRVDQDETEMIDQADENEDNHESNEKSEASTENDEKENVTGVKLNEELEKELRYNLRDKRTQSYKHLYDPAMFSIGNSRDNKQDEVVLTKADDVPGETAQMSMKKGLRMFGKEGYAAVRKEML